MAHRHQLLHPHAQSIIHKLDKSNEQTWLLVGRVAEQMGDLEHALNAYEHALRHNPASVSGLTQVAGIARIKENYAKAVDYFQRVLQIEEDNGEIWSALGHCYLMQDDLQKAYSAYQQALYLLPNPKEDPKLWYGIGILYDRYGSLDHAEEAFNSVLRMCKDLDFDKENEILFRLGIIYKQQGKFIDSLDCFDHILRNPPSPLALADIWFQIGHVFEQQKNYVAAKDAYERVVEANPSHAKVLQQLGWLYHQDGSTFQSQEFAISYLTKSLEADPGDSQSWYLLGRAYMAGQKYNKAYEAYQQAVYRDGRNPTFWCSIGVLYFQINQYRDALDAYSRAIRINPYISEVWFDLGSLYESCNNQITDAIDAYARASELDPSNLAIAHRLQLLKNAQATGSQLPAAPGPQDVHPTAYASSLVPPPGLSGPPLMLQGGNTNRPPPFRTDSRGPPPGEIALAPVPGAGRGGSPPPPFRGGPPPPVILDETRHLPSHTPLAPMETDRPPYHNSREYPRGVPGPQALLSDDHRNNGVHHPQQQDRFRGPPNAHSRSVSPPPQQRQMNGAAGRSPTVVFSQAPVGPPPSGNAYPPPPPPGNRQGPPPPPGVGPAMPNAQRSPRGYHRREPSEQEAWERRAPSASGGPPPPPHEHWDERRGPPPPPPGYQGPPPPPPHHPSYQQQHQQQQVQQGLPPPPPLQQQQQMGNGAGPGAPGFYSPRAHSQNSQSESPLEPSPRVGAGGYANGSVKGSPMPNKYETYDEREGRDPREREVYRDGRDREMAYNREREGAYARERGERSERGGDRSYPVSPANARAHIHTAPGGRASESPMATPVLDGKRRRVPSNVGPGPPTKEEPTMPHAHHPQQFSPMSMPLPMPPSTTAINSAGGSMGEPAPKKERRKRAAPAANGATAGQKRKAEDEGTGSNGAERRLSTLAARAYPIGPGSPADNSSSHSAGSGSGSGSGASRSVQPSPTSAVTPRPPSRMVDEDYDEGVGGVADVLMDLAKYREGAPAGSAEAAAASHSPTVSSHSGRQSHASPRPPPSHRNSVSSVHHASPPPPPSTSSSGSVTTKRPLSPEDLTTAAPNKRTRMDSLKQPSASQRRISSPSAGKRTPVPSTRPSPIPFRTQPTTSHSPELPGASRGASAGDPFNPPSPPLPVVLPPHPRPVGAGHGTTVNVSPASQSGPGVPSIATLPSSPPSTASSPAEHDEKMQVDVASGRGSLSPARSGGAPARKSMGPPSSSGSLSRSPTAMTMKQSQSPPSEKKEM